MPDLRYPRFVQIDGKIFLRIQINGDDESVEITIEKAKGMILDLISWVFSARR